MQQQDQRAELERLRKKKRLMELEAKAAGGEQTQQPAQQGYASLDEAANDLSRQIPDSMRGHYFSRIQRHIDRMNQDPAFSPDEIGVQAKIAAAYDILEPKELDRFQSGMMGASQMAASIPIVGDALVGGAALATGTPMKEARDTIALRQAQSLEQNPVSTRVGQGVTLAAGTGKLAATGIEKGGRIGAAAAQRLGAQGAGTLSRLSRYGGRLVGMAPAGAAEVALFEGTAEADNRGLMSGEDVGLDDRQERFLSALQNPLSYAGLPAASVLYRGARAGTTGTANAFTAAANKVPGVNVPQPFVNSGGQFTPTNVQREVARTTANQAPSSDARQLILDGVSAGESLAGRDVASLERLLRRAGVPANDIGPGLQLIDDRLTQGTASGGLPTRLFDLVDEVFGTKYPQVQEALRSQVQGSAVRSGSDSARRVREVVAEDNIAGRELLQRSARDNLGDASRISVEDASTEALQQLGQQYQKVLGQPLDDGTRQRLGQFAQSDTLNRVKSDLAIIADGEGVSIEAMIARNPAEALHWMQSQARELAEGPVSPRSVAYKKLRNRILNELDSAVPNYRQTRQQYGDEYTVRDALTFGDRFLTVSRDEASLDQFVRAYEALPESAQQSALLSIRDKLLSSAQNTRAEQAPRLTQLTKEGTLTALRRLGDKGAKLADDIEAIDARNLRNTSINPNANSRTASNQEAAEGARRVVRNSLENFLGDLSGNVTNPKGALDRAGTGIANTFRNQTETRVDRLTQLLLSAPQPGAARPQNAFAAARGSAPATSVRQTAQQQIQQMNESELRQVARQLGVAVEGSKPVLANRLMQYMTSPEVRQRAG